MRTELVLNFPTSGHLRDLLENHLLSLSTGDEIGRYVWADNRATTLHMINNYPDKGLAVAHIRIAYNAWWAMDMADRCAVLGKFHQLYVSLSNNSNEGHESLVFCALFIHEFAAIIIEAMEYPD